MYRIVLASTVDGRFVAVDSDDPSEALPPDQVQVRGQRVSLETLAKSELRSTKLVWRCSKPDDYLAVRERFERDRNY